MSIKVSSLSTTTPCARCSCWERGCLCFRHWPPVRLRPIRSWCLVGKSFLRAKNIPWWAAGVWLCFVFVINQWLEKNLTSFDFSSSSWQWESVLSFAHSTFQLCTSVFCDVTKLPSFFFFFFDKNFSWLLNKLENKYLKANHHKLTTFSFLMWDLYIREILSWWFCFPFTKLL